MADTCYDYFTYGIYNESGCIALKNTKGEPLNCCINELFPAEGSDDTTVRITERENVGSDLNSSLHRLALKASLDSTRPA